MDFEHNNLRVYKILYILKGIFTCLVAIIPAIFICVGFLIFNENINDSEESFVGILMVGLGAVFLLFLLIIGVLTILAGIYIGQRRRFTFVLVIAILNCLTGILGILLGIFTILELNKPEVRKLFSR